MGLSAYLSKGEYGAIARLSREYRISRGDVEHCRDAFSAHFQFLFAPTRLSTAPVLTLMADREHIHRALILSLAELPVSIRGLRRLSLNFLHLLIGFGTVWNVIAFAERAAATWLSELSLERIPTIALDELYCQGRWVLVVINVRTQTLCGLKGVDTRTVQAWNEPLMQLRDKQKLHPRTIVSDAGSGLVAAADELFPFARRSHDIFHAKHGDARAARVLRAACRRGVGCLLRRIGRTTEGQKKSASEPESAPAPGRRGGPQAYRRS